MTCKKSVEGVTTDSGGVGGFSPTAAAAVKLLKPGMTLTGMFTEYIEKSNEAERLSAENERLNECMDAMVADIKEKVPLLNKQRADYENAHQVQQELTEQLDETMTELQIAKRELFHANASRSRLARENDAFQVWFRQSQIRAMVRFSL